MTNKFALKSIVGTVLLCGCITYAAAQDAKVKEVILNAGSPVQYLDSPEFEKYVQLDANRMAVVVKRIGKLE